MRKYIVMVKKLSETKEIKIINYLATDSLNYAVIEKKKLKTKPNVIDVQIFKTRK